jgi:hypothetical protein
MYSVSNLQRDDRRRQYDIPTTKAPKALSPELKEVLHMLKAYEADVTKKQQN